MKKVTSSLGLVELFADRKLPALRSGGQKSLLCVIMADTQLNKKLRKQLQPTDKPLKLLCLL